jgi:hypothetical protein
MKVKTMKIYDGKLRLIGKDQEFYLMDGVYRREDGETITVRDHQIVDLLAVPNLKVATKEQLENFLKDLEQQLSTVGDDAQMANVDLQNMLQKQQQTLQMMSNISKMLHDTALAVIRKIG